MLEPKQDIPSKRPSIDASIAKTTVIIASNDDAFGVFNIRSRSPTASNEGHLIKVEEKSQFSVELVVERLGRRCCRWFCCFCRSGCCSCFCYFDCYCFCCCRFIIIVIAIVVVIWLLLLLLSLSLSLLLTIGRHDDIF